VFAHAVTIDSLELLEPRFKQVNTVTPVA